MWFTTSWDDGHPLDLRLAGLMARHGICGTFYCPVENVEGLPVMSAVDMRALDGSYEIGSHTLDHVYANRLSARQWAVQVVRGKAALEDRLGHAVQGFCYPGGKLTRASASAVQRAGFGYARTTENFRVDCGADRLLMPTSLQFFPHSRSVLWRNFAAHGKWGRRWPLARACLSSADFESRLRAALDVATRGGFGFHLWGHSWEIDIYGLWPQLDRFFAHVADTLPVSARLSNAGVLRSLGVLE